MGRSDHVSHKGALSQSQPMISQTISPSSQLLPPHPTPPPFGVSLGCPGHHGYSMGRLMQAAAIFGLHWLFEFAMNYRPDAATGERIHLAACEIWPQICLWWYMAAVELASVHRSGCSLLLSTENDCACLTHGRGNYSIMAHREFCCWDQEFLRTILKACFNKEDETVSGKVVRQVLYGWNL